jgi:hypothetical protein
LRAHKVCQLAAVTLGVLTALALDGGELSLQAADFGLFGFAGGLGEGFEFLEVLKADFGGCLLDFLLE